MKQCLNHCQVLVGVATRHRAEKLRRLLESLVGTSSSPNISWRCVVIENDDDPQCETLVTSFADRIKIIYGVEHRQGIPFARNRILDLLTENDDFLAFVDDDETVDPDWLMRLVDCQRRHHADVVQGRLVVNFEVVPPSWISEDLFCHGGQCDNEKAVRYAATNHVLVRHDVIRQHEIRFNEQLAFNGGDDSLFFMTLHKHGAIMIYCPSAIVYDWIPPERARVKWLVRRSFRLGNSISLCERILAGGISGTFLRFSKAMALFLKALVLLPMACISGRKGLLRCAMYTSRACGMMYGLLGRSYDEYAGR